MKDQPIPVIGSSEVHTLASTAVGDDFLVYVAECGTNPQGVLLVTDGNGLFGLAVDTVRLMQIPGLVPSLIVVAVGYPNASTLLDTAQIRARDLTPTHSATFEKSGHADDFIQFLSDELSAPPPRASTATPAPSSWSETQVVVHQPGTRQRGSVGRMEPTETMPTVEPGRAAALAADATADRPLSPAAKASLERAIERLPKAHAESDDEAQAAAK